jgi:hypothetical protein
MEVKNKSTIALLFTSCLWIWAISLVVSLMNEELAIARYGAGGRYGPPIEADEIAEVNVTNIYNTNLYTTDVYTTNIKVTGKTQVFIDNPPFYFNNATATETDWWMGVPLTGGSADGSSNDGMAVGIASNDTGFGTNTRWRVDPNGLITQAAANNPDVTDSNQYQIDDDDYAIVMSDTTNKYYVAQKVKTFAMTLYDPNAIEVADANVPVMPVEPNSFPGGITLISLGIKTSGSNTCTVTFKDFNSPTDGSPDTLEAISLSAATEAGDDGTLTNTALATGDIIYAVLSGVEDTSNFMQLWGTYYVNTND